jgi:hypothetical protein
MLQLIVTGDFSQPFLQPTNHVFVFEAKAWVTETYSLPPQDDYSSAVSPSTPRSIFLAYRSQIHPKVLAWLSSS